MKKKTQSLTSENDFPVDLTLHQVPASLLTDFAEKIVKPYFRGNLNAAIQDLIHKAMAEQDFVLSHITHVRSSIEAQTVGKTVPSYRWALESEIDGWKGFKRALASKEERDAFEEMMDFCRNNTMASGAACNPKIFEPMVISILMAQQQKIWELEHGLQEVLWRKICNHEKLNLSDER